MTDHAPTPPPSGPRTRRGPALAILLALAAVLPALAAGAAGASGLADALRPSVMPDYGAAIAAVPASAEAIAGSIAAGADLPWFLAPLTARNALLVVHLLGLSVGFGSAIILDVWLLRWMVKGALPPPVGHLFHLLGTAVIVGLALLWASGLGFLLLYAATDPAKLANAKLFGKIGIVCALTLNGVALHRRVLPMTMADLSRPLFAAVPPPARMAALACGALSGASWAAAFLLGILRELNGRISLTEVFGLWLAMVLLAFVAANLLLGGRRGLSGLLAPRARPHPARG